MGELPALGLAMRLEASLGRRSPTREEIEEFFESLGDWRYASVMVEPAYVGSSRPTLNALGQRLATVVAYPLGAMTTQAKVLQAEQALEDGADELDVAMDLSAFRSGDYQRVIDDLTAVRRLADVGAVKAIYYAAALSDEESLRAAELVGEAGVTFLVTNAGSSGRTTTHHIELIRQHFGSALQLMAWGEVDSRADALAMLAAGADRIGTSSLAEVLGPGARDRQGLT